MRTSTFLLPVLSLAPSAFAWGALGHRTVAVVAQNYLSSATKTWVSNILGDTLVNVATWADDYRYTTAGAFSASYHYIDAKTIRLRVAALVIRGIVAMLVFTNYTSRVQSSSLSTSERAIALKFIVHLLGDITQPLHDENKATGGNGISVLWNGATTNLHSVWDSSIAEKYVGGNTVAYATTWGNQIITKLAAGGAYASSKASWLSCVNPSTAQTCALTWATDGNALVCSYVLKTDPTGKELSGTYYTGAYPLVEQQIAKGGVRLAAYLNTIVTAVPVSNSLTFNKRSEYRYE
ncbi:S1/P1 Nuclease [Rhizoctonia solani]|uniref:S1/P1 Nuclease n=1 Tax=Rhizoctonia solani TaxID=456999 RepID=A0A8H7IA66_9AGAM|nr:S1/P1 Nuclease [Rhizoctonia solani]